MTREPIATSDQQEAIERLEQAIALGGSDETTLRVHLARLLNAAQRHAEAWDTLHDAILDDPGDVDALELAATALKALGCEERAERYISAADRAESRHNNRESTTSAPVLRLVTPDASTPKALTLRDVAGMEKVKRRLQLSFLGPLRNPQLRALYGKSLRGGLLLWGPPGCGKTFLAKAVAGELGASFISVGLDDVLDMYAGQSERNVSGLFATARRQAPCVLFFDELDALGQKRSNLRGAADRNVVVQLLTELDGVDSQNEGVFVLGATNHPWDVDTALRRPGRFDRTLLVLPPDETARAAILQQQLAERPTEGLDLAVVAQRTAGYSGADLVHLCETATELALAEAVESGSARPVLQSDLLLALQEVSGSTSDWLGMARNYAEFASESRDAYSDLLAYIKREKGR